MWKRCTLFATLRNDLLAGRQSRFYEQKLDQTYCLCLERTTCHPDTLALFSWEVTLSRKHFLISWASGMLCFVDTISFQTRSYINLCTGRCAPSTKSKSSDFLVPNQCARLPIHVKEPPFLQVLRLLIKDRNFVRFHWSFQSQRCHGVFGLLCYINESALRSAYQRAVARLKNIFDFL